MKCFNSFSKDPKIAVGKTYDPEFSYVKDRENQQSNRQKVTLIIKRNRGINTLN
jgi:hypothetical protein